MLEACVKYKSLKNWTASDQNFLSYLQKTWGGGAPGSPAELGLESC